MLSTVIKTPLCPHCNTAIKCEDTYDIYCDEEESIILYQVGYCPKCGKDYQWQRSACCIQWANTDLREC
jgi:endogenous inhibitor of DNA gyrase (YacG/DUF329 family)